MAIAHVATSTVTSGGVVTPPANTAGQLMLLHFSACRGVTITGISESGWTKIGQIGTGTSFDQDVSTEVWWKIATGSTASITLSLSAAYESRTAITTWSGVSTINPVSALSTSVNASFSLNVTLTGVTPAYQNGMLVAAVAAGANGTSKTVSSNSGMTELYDASSMWIQESLYYEPLTAAAATGNREFTISGSSYWAGLLFTLNDAAYDTAKLVGTSTAASATSYPAQRKIDRTSNGVLWSFFENPGATMSSIYPRYSTDKGVTWTEAARVGDGNPQMLNGSVFIDVDDNCHLVWMQRANSGTLTGNYIYYIFGTPNASRTAWTWGAPVGIWLSAGNGVDAPDIVAHREGTGWAAHIVHSRNDTLAVCYNKVSIASNGTYSAPGNSTTWTTYGASALHTHPSIDFNHTGDGKTVAGGTPHLYVAWSSGATGAGRGIRFRKGTYSAGSWAWAEQEIDSTRYVQATHWLNCLFDGTRVLIGGNLFDGSNSDIVLHERDAANTTTTTRVLVENAAITGTTSTSRMLSGSMSYDTLGNVYFQGFADYVLFSRKWTRATSTFETPVAIGTATQPYVSTKRGPGGSRIDFIYTAGSASPYNVLYNNRILNYAPTVTLTNPGTVDPRASKTITWSFSDPDAGNTQTAYELDIRVTGGTWTSLSTGTTASSYNIPAYYLTDETNYEIRVRVKDSFDWSAYDTKTFTADSWTYLSPDAIFTTESGYDDIVKADGPVGYWRLGETSGTVAVDSSGNGNSGAYRGTPTRAPGAIANDPDGAVGVYGASEIITATPTHTWTNNVTAEAWVNLDSLGTTRQSAISWNEDVAGGAGLVLAARYDSDSSLVSAWVYVNGTWNLVVGTRGVGINEWFHLATTFDGSVLRLYVNGSQVGSSSVTGTLGSLSGKAIGIGGRSSLDVHNLIGEIDEAAVYNRALTAAEIKRHYDAGKRIAKKISDQFPTTSLSGLGEYEIQVRASDQDAAGTWSEKSTFILDQTAHHVYVNGAWRPVKKQEYWIDSWKYGEATNF